MHLNGVWMFEHVQAHLWVVWVGTLLARWGLKLS